LISMLVEEADRQKARKGFGKAKEEHDEALSAGESSKRKNKDDMECWNCGEKGHLKWKCKNPPKNPKDDSKSTTETKKDATANAAEAEAKSEDEGAWAAVEEAVDWFQEVVNELIDDEMNIPLEIAEVVEDEGAWAAAERVVDDDSNFEEIPDTELGVNEGSQMSKDWFETIADEMISLETEGASIEGEIAVFFSGIPDEDSLATRPGVDGEIAKLCGSGYTNHTPEYHFDDLDGTQVKTVERLGNTCENNLLAVSKSRDGDGNIGVMKMTYEGSTTTQIYWLNMTNVVAVRFGALEMLLKVRGEAGEEPIDLPGVLKDADGGGNARIYGALKIQAQGLSVAGRFDMCAQHAPVPWLSSIIFIFVAAVDFGEIMGTYFYGEQGEEPPGRMWGLNYSGVELAEK
jgi:hypothetical protein